MPNKVNSVFFRIPEGVMGYNVKILNYVGGNPDFLSVCDEHLCAWIHLLAENMLGENTV